MNHRAILRYIFTLLVLFVPKIHGQGISTDGKDFYIGFVNPSFSRVAPNTAAVYIKAYLLIGSYQNNTVSVSYFKEDGTEDTLTQYTISARKFIQIPLDLSRMRMTDPGDILKEYRSVHVTSQKPVSIQYFSTGPSSCGMYTSIPTTLLGRKYVIASYNDNPEGNLSMIGGNGPSVVDVACGFFEIVATKNGTLVTITPTTTTQGGKHIGVNTGEGSTGKAFPYTISLNRGQCYMVKSGCINNTFDFTGSIIESDKPIAVISGHENAGIGGLGNRPLEGRDYMVEQMMPVNHWDDEGYISIPFVDSQPANDEGTGEHFRVIVHDSSGVNVSLQSNGVGGTTILPVGRYATKQASDISQPSSFASNTKPFMVYQIDQANHSSREPYPRPSITQLIPLSRWKNAYLWFVPSNANEKLQGYYVNIIGPKDNSFDSILISKNGQKEAKIRSAGLSQVGQYLSIPGYPDLKAIRYKVTPGSYYARAKFPFMIYHYGNRAIDPDGDLGDFDGDDYFFSYATHLGYQFTSPNTGSISVSVDTLCNSWKVCMTDTSSDGGIASISLLDDPYGDFIIPPSGHAPYQYSNVAFDPNDDPRGTREIIFSGDNTSECVRINIQNPGKDGYAPLLVTTIGGETRIIELSLAKSAISLVPDPAKGGNLGLRKVGSALDTLCMFINLLTSSREYRVSDVSLIGQDTSMKILSVTPLLPALIKPGDTLKYVVRFTAVDTAKHYDTLRIVTDCSSFTTPLMGEGGCGIITATDVDFGYIISGGTRCIDTLQITNTGKLPFTLSRDLLLQDTLNFSIDIDNVTYGGNDVPLPVLIAAGADAMVTICYHPKEEGSDSTAIIWKTDIPSPYSLSTKTFSIVRGRGSVPLIVWDIVSAVMMADTTKPTIMRRYLSNSSAMSTVIDKIMIVGKDSAEFSIDKMEYIPPILIDSSVKFWVDIAFRPDMTKPDSLRFADRHAQAVATNTFDANKPAILEILGTFKTLSVSGDLRLESLMLSPNPSSAAEVIVSFGLETALKLSFTVYDMLGREVVSVSSSSFAKGNQRVAIPTAKLPEGSYILRVSDGTLLKSLSFRIVK